MNCALKISTVRQEAETYLAHGLYREAMDVYENYLSKSIGIHPDLKNSITEAMRHIRSAAGKINWDGDESMPHTKTSKTDKGLSGNPSINQRLINARAYANMDRHDRALEEYNRLLDIKYITSEVINGVALCLLHLVQPNNIVAVLDDITRDIFKHPRNRKAFKLSIAKKIDPELHPQHWTALSHLLVRKKPLQ